MAQRMKRKFKILVPQSAEKKYCHFCTINMHSIDYKNGEFLRRFMNSEGKIYPRRKTGTCASDQRELAEAIKRARFLALVPYTLRVKRRP
ncbi:MAG: 30S ribosomal protein S18 [Patescibacteria group bacterium]